MPSDFCVTWPMPQGDSNGLSHDEIAITLGSPLGTIKSWVRRGLISLRQCLEA